MKTLTLSPQLSKFSFEIDCRISSLWDFAGFAPGNVRVGETDILPEARLPMNSHKTLNSCVNMCAATKVIYCCLLRFAQPMKMNSAVPGSRYSWVGVR